MIANASLVRYPCDGFVIANASQTIADTEDSNRGQRSELTRCGDFAIHSSSYVPLTARLGWMGEIR